MNLVSIVRSLHIVAGCAALATFWIPLVTRKGGGVHRAAGWAYVAAVALITATGVPLAGRYLVDANPRNDTGGWFLLYVALLGATSTSMGVRALRTRRRVGPVRNAWDLGLPALLVVGGLGIGLHALRARVPTLGAFAALGVALGVGQLRFWLRAPESRMAWWFQHMTGMGTSCIATVTAFVVVNAAHAGVARWNLVVWTGPAVLGGLGLYAWSRHFRARFAASLPAAPRAPRTWPTPR